MSDKNIRHPFRNFFIKRSVQFPIVARILVVIFLTSLVTTLVLVLIYKLKSHTGTFYYMGEDIDPMELHGILGVILPALISAQVATLAIGIGVGLFSSRKVAVPLYKLEKWAQQVKSGKLNTHLAFRETEEMRDLTVQCNALVDTYKHIFAELERSVDAIDAATDKPEIVAREVSKIRGTLRELEYN